MRASIVAEMIAVIGIVMLGALLYVTLKGQNRNTALVALGLYLVTAAIIAVSRIAAFALLRTSQESVIAGHPVYLQTLAACRRDSFPAGQIDGKLIPCLSHSSELIAGGENDGSQVQNG